MLLNNFVPGLRYGAKILPSEIVGGGMTVFGNSWYVDPTNGSDSDTGQDPDHAFASIGAAVSAATTNNHDVIFLSAYAAHAQTSMLTITKNRLHFIGCDLRTGIGMGARTRITMGDSTVTADIALMQNTGVGNTFENIKFDSSSTVAASLYGVAEGGEFTIYNRCEFYKSTDLNETAAAEVLNNGDSVQWLNCVFGSSVNSITTGCIRANMLLTATLSGKRCRDNFIDNCIFLSKSDGTAQVKIYGANATDVERMFLVQNSVFYNNILSSQTPAHAVGFGAAQTEGAVLLKNCTSVDHVVMKQASMAIYVDGAVPTHNTTGVSVTG